ncbi:tail fiber [Aeromonas phage ST4]|nr:tail fiber [Aeromonas phage ST4]
MFDERSTNFNLQLPNLSNPLRVDVERLCTTITTLDTLLKNIETAANAAMHYVGDWDAATNTPAIPAATAENKGSYYLVAVSGTTAVDGVAKWAAGDWIVSNGAKWVRIANSEVFDAAAIQTGIFDQARIPEIPIERVTGLHDVLNASLPMTQITGLPEALDTKQPNLGFTPVQQGGGVNQLTNKVKIGWGTDSRLRVTVDATDLGYFWTSNNLNPASYFPVAGGAFTGMVYTASLNGSMVQGYSNASLEVRNGSGTGDWGMASIGFHAQGAYGINLGLRADGYFGIGGWSSVAWRWYSTPGGDMIASGNIGAYSDPRLKDEVELIAGALDIVDQLSGVRFTWNNKTKLIGKPGQRDIGVLADQVEAVLPELVTLSMPDSDNDGQQWRVVDYAKLTPVLIEAVKELGRRVKELEAR